MRALFLGNVAADTAEGIRAELPSDLELEILRDEKEILRSSTAAAAADILVSNHWRAAYPPAPNVKLVQSVATGVELFELAALPKGAAVCNAFGHETAIAEYVVMTWLALHHHLPQISSEFRTRGSWRSSWVESGAPHGEVRGSTLGIVGYGRVGREVARRAAPFGVRILAANRSPREPEQGVERIYKLAELDRMLPECDTVALCTALGPETTGLIDARRLALMKPTAVLINIGRALIVEEAALYEALRDKRIGAAAIDVWWRYPTPAEPNARPSHFPFHELPNALMTPHCSSATDGARDRRMGAIAGNLDRFVRGEPLINVVTKT